MWISDLNLGIMYQWSSVKHCWRCCDILTLELLLPIFSNTATGILKPLPIIKLNTTLNGRFHLVYYYQDPEQVLDQENSMCLTFLRSQQRCMGSFASEMVNWMASRPAGVAASLLAWSWWRTGWSSRLRQQKPKKSFISKCKISDECLMSH